MAHPQPLQRELFPGRERVPAPRSERIAPPGERLLRALRRRWLVALAAFVLTAAAVCAGVALLPKQYQAQAAVEFSTPPELLHDSSTNPLAVATPDDLHTLEWQFGSRAAVQATAAALHLDGIVTAPAPRRLQAATDLLLQHLELDPVEQSRVLVLRYRDRDPRRAAQVVNTLVAITLQQMQQQRRRGLDQAQTSLTRQLQQAGQALQATQQNLHDVAAAAPEVLSGASDSASAAADRLRALEAASTQAGIEAAHLQAELQSGPAPATALPLPEGLGSDLTAQLLTRRADVEARIHRLAAQYVPTALPLLQARQELASIDASLLRYRQAGRQRVQQQLQASRDEQARLAAAIQRQQQRLAEEQAARLRYADLQRESAVAAQLCDALQARRQQLVVAAAWIPLPARLADAATPPASPVRPRLALTLVVALLAASVVAPAAALAVDHADGRLYLPEAAELGVPLLATVPRSFLAVEFHGPIAYQVLDPVLLAMRMAARKYGSQLFAVVAPREREDQSPAIASLAQKLAETGDTVLVIDAEPYRRRHSDVPGLTSVSGLAEVLLGKLTFDAVILQVSPPDRRGKWDLLPPGALDSVTAQVFLMPAMQNLLQAVRSRYQWVLMASGPVLQEGHVRALLDQADAGILVLPSRGPVRSNARAALRLLREWRSPILGMVRLVEDRPQVFPISAGRSVKDVTESEELSLTNLVRPPASPVGEKQSLQEEL